MMLGYLSTPFHKYADVLFNLQGLCFLCHRGDWCHTMPRTSPFVIRLSSSEAAELRRRAARYTLPYFQVQRAKMILMAAEGWSNDQIAKRLATRRDVVSTWRKRFFTDRLAGLEERSRPGRPRTFPP
jgi:Winged helix-turn helix